MSILCCITDDGHVHLGFRWPFRVILGMALSFLASRSSQCLQQRSCRWVLCKSTRQLQLALQPLRKCELCWRRAATPVLRWLLCCADVSTGRCNASFLSAAQDAAARGCANRKAGAGSSRSHVIVRVAVTLRRRLKPSQAAASASGMAPEQRAVLQLVDLAGNALLHMTLQQIPCDTCK